MKQPSRDRTLGRHSMNAVVLKARFWHECEVPTASEIVRFSGKTGSERPTIKVTRLTHLRHAAKRRTRLSVTRSKLWPVEVHEPKC
jgi:hypothetical protein